MNGYFITGTDTGVGKTWTAAALVYKYAQQGTRVAGMKPLSCGARHTDQGWRHDDAVLLWQQCSVALSYAEINPYCLPAAIAPHLAAEEAGVVLDAALLAACCTRVAQRADMLIVEGVGGWQVPLNAQQTTADFARVLGLPVILVVGMRLGCLNHALLTYEAITRCGLSVAGWVANSITPEMSRQAGNIATLRALLPCPLLATIPYLDGCKVAHLATYFSSLPNHPFTWIPLMPI